MLETLHELCKFIDVNGRAPTHEELAEKTGKSDQTIWRHLHKLEDAGYIKILGTYRIQLLYRVNAVL